MYLVFVNKSKKWKVLLMHSQLNPLIHIMFTISHGGINQNSTILKISAYAFYTASVTNFASIQTKASCIASIIGL